MEGSFHGFNAIDKYGRNVRVFLDAIEILVVYLAVTAGADISGQTAESICSFCEIMKRKRVVSPPMCYKTTRHSRRSSLARFDEHMTNIRSSGVTPHLNRHLGTTCSTEQEVKEQFEVNLAISLRIHKDKVQLNSSGDKVVDCFFDLYQRCAAVLDHMFKGLLTNFLTVCFNTVPTNAE